MKLKPLEVQPACPQRGPSADTKRAAEAATKRIQEARAGRMAAALSSANRKTGLFKK
jgi:hypothetical protein